MSSHQLTNRSATIIVYVRAADRRCLGSRT